MYEKEAHFVETLGETAIYFAQMYGTAVQFNVKSFF